MESSMYKEPSMNCSRFSDCISEIKKAVVAPDNSQRNSSSLKITVATKKKESSMD